MKGKILSFIFVLILCNISIVHAEELLTLHVHVKGTEDYQVHDELVSIREYNGEQNESPIVVQNRTVEQATATFHLSPGRYWVDVRNLWVLVNLTEDELFIFPYTLYQDEENYTGEQQEKTEDIDLTPAVILSVAIIICSIIFIVVSHVKRMKAKELEKQSKQKHKPKV